MTTTRTPDDLFAEFQRGVLGDGLPLTEDMLAEDVVVEMPFLPAGMPRRIEGRDAYLAFSEAADAGHVVRFTEFRDVVVHRTADPEVIIAEYELAGTRTDTGATGSSGFVIVLRARDGRIAHWREYQNVPAMGDLMGGLG
ncbi:nuclear transport factor 2 family protein [Actinomadura flavalba]|uniref:nuclear transport factor 2 family protein n=1 Tax=Actinomadura flavalba TaxID=1120938 RepID=UPI00035CB85B|nr:nuclear transport factor 2 family protein [Actinomadura flavalba]